MEYQVQTVIGPRTASMSREDALVALQTQPEYPKNAILAGIDDKNGQWVAKLRVPKIAAPFPPGPAGPDDEAPTPPGGPDEGPPKDEGESGPPDSEVPDEKSDDGPPKEDGEKGKKPSVEHAVAELTSLVHQIADALGVGGGGLPGAGPEADDGMLPGPPGAPPGAGGPPAGPGGHPGAGGPPGGPGAVQRSRPLKPGEAHNTPGSVTVGAPAFSSVDDSHPWKGVLGKVATFNVSNPVEVDDDKVISRATADLNDLAGNVWDKTANNGQGAWVPGPNATGYKVRQVKRGTNEEGTAVVRALISKR